MCERIYQARNNTCHQNLLIADEAPPLPHYIHLRENITYAIRCIVAYPRPRLSRNVETNSTIIIEYGFLVSRHGFSLVIIRATPRNHILAH